ncbi:protein transporter tim10 [Cymbomonas tetramitiformis]|uniref:Mitochondrial import inner membrane translocase subunit n=1 Tax=Cymbomonas tetramitiformis TaxID=36881 RepID=A0AAE0BL00_9CHLO|nr:protein transporter tim10 [Cymbomonas tetramitiformis]
MSEVDRAKALKMAEVEMEYRVDLFTRLSSVCFDKCIDHKYKDGDLNVGENSCVDRCSSKYWQVVGIVGQLLGANQQQPPR